MSALRDTMAAQPALLEAILADPAPVERVADRLTGRRVLLVGTGTSFHAAQQGAALLRRAGLEAWAVAAADAALGDPAPGDGDALVLLSHRGWKRATSAVLARARDHGVPTIVVSGQGSPSGADVETTPQETSATFTASHLGALARLAQLAAAHGAPLARLNDVPAAVAAELDAPPAGVAVPERLMEYAGAGINAWTAAEGALKIAEAAFVASEGLAVESVIHGPSAALGERDALVCLDGGGPGSARIDDLATVVAAHGAAVHRFSRTELGELLSIFPLTVVVQKIAAEASEALGTNPDTMGRDLPGRDAAWQAMEL
jgi:glutamine---fructose-6-phosphate transaminase (isomerizing)